MKFTDLIALAKNGYSPKDIKDLLALADPEPEPEPAPADPEPQEDPKDPDPAEPEDKKTSEQQKDDTDYKKLYTDLLAKYQEQNRHQNTEQPEVPAEEKLADIFRGMM